MNYLNIIQSTSAIAGIAMICLGSRWLKAYLWSLI